MGPFGNNWLWIKCSRCLLCWLKFIVIWLCLSWICGFIRCDKYSSRLSNYWDLEHKAQASSFHPQKLLIFMVLQLLLFLLVLALIWFHLASPSIWLQPILNISFLININRLLYGLDWFGWRRFLLRLPILWSNFHWFYLNLWIIFFRRPWHHLSAFDLMG